MKNLSALVVATIFLTGCAAAPSRAAKNAPLPFVGNIPLPLGGGSPFSPGDHLTVSYGDGQMVIVPSAGVAGKCDSIRQVFFDGSPETTLVLSGNEGEYRLPLKPGRAVLKCGRVTADMDMIPVIQER
jgi:hypothetical protein